MAIHGKDEVGMSGTGSDKGVEVAVRLLEEKVAYPWLTDQHMGTAVAQRLRQALAVSISWVCTQGYPLARQ